MASHKMLLTSQEGSCQVLTTWLKSKMTEIIIPSVKSDIMGGFKKKFFSRYRAFFPLTGKKLTGKNHPSGMPKRNFREANLTPSVMEV